MKITIDIPETCPKSVGKDLNEADCVECPLFDDGVGGEYAIICRLPQDKELEKTIRRVLELDSGKVVLVSFGDIAVRSGYECQDKNTDVCNECQIRFACYLNQYLIIEAKDLNLRLDTPLDEIVERYVERHKPKSK